jgi:hypothetical protein
MPGFEDSRRQKTFSHHLNPCTFKPSYDTTPKWHSFFLDQSGRLRPAAGLNPEPLTYNGQFALRLVVSGTLLVATQ